MMAPVTAESLRSRRLALGLTQVQLADALGVTQQQMSDWERRVKAITEMRAVWLDQKLAGLEQKRRQRV
jgi:transcriptional regulator with XRE-family HTH domain